MDQIQNQINVARRRLAFGDFLKALGMCLTAGLSLALLATCIPKIWYVTWLSSSSDLQTWQWSWIAGGLLLGFLTAMVWSWVKLGDRLELAIEIDRLFQLKERISSAISLTETDRHSDAGRALMQDAIDRAETIDVRDKIDIRPGSQLLLPLVPTALLAIIFFVPNAQAKVVSEKLVDRKNEVKAAIEESRKKITEKIEEMTARGLADAENLQSLQKEIDNLSSKLEGDPRDSLVQLNNIKKQVEERQRQLGGDSQEMKKQLNKLGQINEGPAKKISEALNQGDFEAAEKAIKELVKDLKEGKLSDAEIKKLAENLNMISDELQKLQQRHEQAKQNLRDEIQKANREGDLEKAAKLQQQLEKMEKQDQQVNKMKQMAEKMQACANCMKNAGKAGSKEGKTQAGQQANQAQPSDGDLQQAIESLEELDALIEGMNKDLDELENLEQIAEELELAKCKCNGCRAGDKVRWQDWAEGAGRGAGKRASQETETGDYESRVRGTIQKGETVVSGSADGNNVSGKSIAEVREIVRSSFSKTSDPLENQNLPRTQREHARQYFENLREK
jgi:DNA-binding ferritin-like protein